MAPSEKVSTKQPPKDPSKKIPPKKYHDSEYDAMFDRPPSPTPPDLNLTAYPTFHDNEIAAIDAERRALPEPSMMTRALARYRAQQEFKPDICSSYFRYFVPGLPEGKEMERLRELCPLLFDWQTANFAFVETMTQQRMELGVLPKAEKTEGMCLRADYRATMWNVLIQNSPAFEHIDHETRTHVLECPIRDLHAQLLIMVLDEFIVRLKGFPHIIHVMHQITKDMTSAIKEGMFEAFQGELHYTIMLTMVYRNPEKGGKLDNLINVLNFRTTPDLRNWVLKSGDEKRSMDKVKVKLVLAERQYRFNPRKHEKAMKLQNLQALELMKEFKPKRWLVTVPPWLV